mmetsp:Transcript_125680/g.187628  ORF Transcript_125680/g.187628 Transcript_125680/m.187628 type:complete len:82 (-) Transcript_125680:24-269(-)
MEFDMEQLKTVSGDGKELPSSPFSGDFDPPHVVNNVVSLNPLTNVPSSTFHIGSTNSTPSPFGWMTSVPIPLISHPPTKTL